MNKTNIYILLFSLSVLIAGLFQSCSDDDDDSTAIEDIYITLFPFIEQERSRVIGSHFESGDKIGVFVVPYEEDNVSPGSISESTYAPNTEIEFNGSTWTIPSGGRIYFPDRTRKVDLFAYYPYDPTVQNTNSRQYLFSVNTDQRTKNGYEYSDLLWSSAQGVSPTRTPVDLSFSHVLSKIRINIKSEIPEVEQQLENAVVSVLNTRQRTSVDLSTGNNMLDDSSDLAEIFTFHHSTPASGYTRSCEAILIPQTLGSNTPFIRIDIPSVGSRYTYTSTSDLLLETGTERTINITITELGLSVSVGSISEWQESEVIEGEIGTPIPKVVDLSTIDWNTSLVHKVYDNGVQIGQICREYLFKTGTGGVDVQAIVVYRMSNTGIVNDTLGYAVQVMNRNRNTVTQQYEPNPGNVHGGTVTWGIANNSLQAYAAGTSSLINKVEFAGQGVAAAPANAITTLRTMPDYMTDVDGNNYSIVKISSQYWMAENLKVERYKDGTPLTYYYYNDNNMYKDIFGALYAWNTIMDVRGIAPDGWRVPENAMFLNNLYPYLTPDAGRKLKANTLWSNLNFNDNVTGFGGLPGGRRTNTGVYNEVNNYGQWWTSTATTANDAYRLYLEYSNNAMHNPTLNKAYTQSIRLIKNRP